MKPWGDLALLCFCVPNYLCIKPPVYQTTCVSNVSNYLCIKLPDVPVAHRPAQEVYCACSDSSWLSMAAYRWSHTNTEHMQYMRRYAHGVPKATHALNICIIWDGMHMVYQKRLGSEPQPGAKQAHQPLPDDGGCALGPGPHMHNVRTHTHASTQLWEHSVLFKLAPRSGRLRYNRM